MEGLFFLLGLLFVGAFLVAPIVTLAKMSSMNKQLFNLKSQIKELDAKLLYVINNTVHKKEKQTGLKAMPASTIAKKEQVQVVAKQETSTYNRGEKKIDILTPTPSVEDSKVVSPTDTIIPKPKEEKKPTFEPLDKPIDKPEAVKEKLQPTPQAESQPAYVAADKPERKIIAPTAPKVVRQVAPPKVEQSENSGRSFIERVFGENWLSKIGIVTLVLGVGFFVKYAIDQNWINEIARVGIGIFTGGLIIAIAHKLKEKHHVFSSILVGGGISILYITITLAFREYEIFSQTVAFVLLTVVTIFSVILSLFYNRQELAIFSLLGGFASPLMVSTGSGNYIVLFSFILILNTGMLLISLKRDWRLVGIVSYVLSLCFFWIWLLIDFQDRFAGATIFASLFFVQFYLLAIIKHFREDRKLSIFQAVLILTNNLSILLALMYIFDSYPYDVKGLAVMALAVVNAIMMLTLFRNSKVDKNLIYMIIGLVMSLVTLAVPIQLKGYVITMFWAVEMALLLWLWQKTKINVFRLGFLVTTALTIVSYLMDVSTRYGTLTYVENPILNSILITGVVVLAGFAISLFLWSKEEEDVTIKSRHFMPISSIKYALKFILILLAFFVPYLELNYQLAVHTDVEYVTESFRYTTMATYAICFVAVLGILFKHRMDKLKYFFFLFVVALYASIYTSAISIFREDVFYSNLYSSGYFLVHFLSLPAVGYLFYLLVANMRNLFEKGVKVLAWILVILSVVILSRELEHVVVWLVGNTDNYYSLLKDVYTFGYPILWGLMAMLLMIWGLKKNEVILRQISLISFGLIIVKFYAYDVWLMSQGGRIVSFVALGVILLVVSFLLQKIKTLVKEDEKAEVLENENEKL